MGSSSSTACCTGISRHPWLALAAESELSQQRSANLGYDVCRYYKKLQFRDEIEALKPEEFLTEQKYKNTHIWDLKYLSTSDDDDGISSGADSEEDEEEEKSNPENEAIKEDSDEDDSDSSKS